MSYVLLDVTLKKKLCENAHQGLGRRRKTLFLKSLTSFTTAFEAVIKIHVSHILNNQAAHHYSTHQCAYAKTLKNWLVPILARQYPIRDIW